MTGKVRVRFAPSPTGPLHIGGVRTALYNYLFARKNDGVMILRIEDTDQTRYVPGAEAYIMESLKWCGIHIDEGIEEGGPFAPYRQSERKDIYREYAFKLLDERKVYMAFDTAEALDAARKKAESEGRSFQYDHSVRMQMQNSLSLPKETVDGYLAAGKPYVLRMLIHPQDKVIVNDLIRGRVEVDSSTLDDKVLYKSDGMPTYHLANVIDDHLMGITHVIRGEEWLPSAPLHVLLYQSLGWAGSMPQFAHLPLLLKPDGNGKLSKRDGDRLGFPVFPLRWQDPNSGEISSGYRESGYIAEAFINMLAFLGWNPGTEQEIFSMEELIRNFSLERVGKAGARFDPEKAKWYNHQYLINTDRSILAKELGRLLEKKGIAIPDAVVLEEIISMVQPRLHFIHELEDQTDFFFIRPERIHDKDLKNKWKPDSETAVLSVVQLLKDTEPFSGVTAKEKVMEYITANNLNTGMVMNSLRLLIVGASRGPDLFGIISVIGRDEALARIESGLKCIREQKS